MPLRGSRARAIERRLKAAANPDRARVLQGFFKTGPGQYGEGDRFLGLTVPQIRTFVSAYRETSLTDVETLMDSPWHESRLLALLILAKAYRNAERGRREGIFRLYLRRTDRINSWDLVDATAPGIVGAHLLGRSRGVLRRLARSKSVWERRIAMVATHHFIRQGQFDDTLRLAEMLLGDRHDLIHKAVGWMLREVGKQDEPALLRFLDRHAPSMPRTALRDAIERLPLASRRRYLAIPARRKRA